jgi:ABC-type uncharacterized transport system substrate-binding protein
MRRRDFIKVIGGAAATMPFVARAQPTGRVGRIAVLVGFAETDPEAPSHFAALRQSLERLGWKEGVNLRIDVRFGAGDMQKMKVAAKELLDMAPDVVIADSTPASLAVQRETKTHTGQYWGVLEAAAAAAKVTFSKAGVESVAALARAVEAMASRPGGGFLIMPDAFTMSHRAEIIALTERHRVPAIYPYRVFAASGGLISYGMDRSGVYRDAAIYADRILRGEKPADLPVQAPSKLELVINLKTAKALGLDVPPTLLARADEVIE